MIAQPQEIEPLLKASLGSQARLVSCQFANRQPDYCVVLARLERPDLEVVIKLAGPQADMACQFDRTARLHELVARRTAIPMPETIAVDVTLQTWPWRYLIRTALPGAEWAVVRSQMSAAEQASAYRQTGEAAAQLHQIGFSAFGELDADCQVARPAPSCLSALEQHAARILPNPRLLEAFLSTLAKRASLFEPVQGASLCHEDLHGYNILFAKQAGEWRLSAILDFDKAWAGHAETDLARLEIWRGMTSPDFWAAYRALRPVEEGYLERRPVYQLLWCLEYARSTREHFADTRRVCQELGEQVIRSFD